MRILTYLAPLFVAIAASAQDKSSCLKIENDLDRLTCYDKESGRDPEIVAVETDGKWQVETKKSEFKDTTDVYLSVATDENLDCGMFDHEPGTLLLRCMENKTAAMLITGCHMASGFSGYGRVEYRVDNKAAMKRNFDASTDNKALGLWDGGDAIPFIKELIDGKTLIMRFTPFNESPTTAKFDISGLAKAIEPLREECGW